METFKNIIWKVIDLFKVGKKLTDKVNMQLSIQEGNISRKALTTWTITSPKVLKNDHKIMDERGELPTRLVISAKKFTATFSKISYLGIKKMLDKANIKYSQVTIFQEYGPKNKM